MKASSIRLLLVLITLVIVAAVASAALAAPALAADRSENLPPPAAPAWFGCVHTVRTGETFFSIALMHGMSPFTLVDMNGMSNFGFLFPGIVLRVPCFIAFPSPVFQPVIVQPQPSAGICNIHFVQRGEWLVIIARRFGVTWQAIAAVNGLFNPNLIFPGMRLLIPCSARSSTLAPTTGNVQIAPAPAPAPTAGTVTAMMMNIMFSPATINIRVGQSVMWQNMDSVQHSATQGTCTGNVCAPTPGGFDTGILNPGQTSGSITFHSAGTFHFYCRVHGAMMQGDVVVMP